jgi:hypothetical protein
MHLPKFKIEPLSRGFLLCLPFVAFRCAPGAGGRVSANPLS